ncbi:MAG TPA: hypothetical protein VFT40_07365 [Sphingomicrobium sp.]|nr:hypothetical protein [Sphingomicrobium sp.]
MAESRHIVAIGLLTQQDLEMLGQGFDRAFPIDDALVFEDLLQAIDRADRELALGGQAS